MDSDQRSSFQCPKCGEFFTSPKSLPCGHVLCTQCKRPFPSTLPDAHLFNTLLKAFMGLFLQQAKAAFNSSKVPCEITFLNQPISLSLDQSFFPDFEMNQGPRVDRNRYHCTHHPTQTINSYCLEWLQEVCPEYKQV